MERRDLQRAEKVALLALLHHDDGKRSRPQIREAILEGASAREILAGPNALFPAESVEEALTASLADLATWESQGIHVLTPLDDDYPAQMFSVHDFPLVLFGRGTVLDDYRSAAIVGSREFSVGGQQYAAELATLLAGRGITVVSGLARGIDITAHRAALRAGGRTVSVLGNGLSHTYPAEHRETQEEIGRVGLLLSQFRPETRGSKQTFPQRNMTMSAYSSLTVIVEAKEASGTRIQARAAINHGRPLVLTEQVVDATSWGRGFASGSYDVTVAPTPAEALAAIEGVLARSEEPLTLAR
ncbi:MAG: DNA-protecting protein DprA [Micrococcales bacterium]|nr:DNA-protecting protein DprA [Micrococcales bacterium]OJX69388.1 MAG: hypothetical protein BGO94_12765 [Micrococcales bacterium 72-143]